MKEDELVDVIWQDFANMWELTFKKKARRTGHTERVLFDWYLKGYIAGATHDLE